MTPTKTKTPRYETPSAPLREGQFIQNFVTAATTAPFFRDLLRAAHLRKLPRRLAA